MDGAQLAGNRRRWRVTGGGWVVTDGGWWVTDGGYVVRDGIGWVTVSLLFCHCEGGGRGLSLRGGPGHARGPLPAPWA